MIIAIANQKGGVGKTTTSINLSSGLAREGFKTLLLDCDPQCNSTSAFFSSEDTQNSTFSLFLKNDTESEALIRETKVTNLFSIPSSIHLAKVERSLTAEIDAPLKLKKSLSKFKKNFDFIIIDTPPSLGLLTVNALIASDTVLIPITPSPWSIEGVQDFMDTFKSVKETFNEKLKLLGVLITMYDSRTLLAKESLEQIKNIFGTLIFNEIIHRSVRLEESPAYKEDIFSFAPSSTGAESYKKIVKEVISRAKK